ncbi:MAG: MarR family transcriptional regulator, partial [Coriobacteriia bacterium]|nr:MarR family transcriptional regulator [Coriobacteriia bacterium]
MITKEQEIDQVDQIIYQWSRVRPDLDVSPMGIVGRISRLGVLLVKEQTKVFERYGLDFAAFDVLATLFRSGSPYELSPSHLARSMMVTPGAVTQRLTRMESDGLIARTHNTDDRRGVTVRLTEQGQKLVGIVLPEHLANERRLLSALNASEL